MFAITMGWICIIVIGLLVGIPVLRIAVAIATNPLGAVGTLLALAGFIAGGGGWLMWWITSSSDALFWGILGIIGFIGGLIFIGWGSARSNRVVVYHDDYTC